MQIQERDFCTHTLGDFTLLDAGAGRRLERWGAYILDRPDAAVVTEPAEPGAWAQADATFTGIGGAAGGSWQRLGRMPLAWPVRVADWELECRLTEAKHTGLFPEQWPLWLLLTGLTPGTRLLHLFGYTGMAGLAAATAGATVTHVDASKPALAWARSNALRNGFGDGCIRWLHDDARAFAARERRRKQRYQAIVLDPPAFGRGPKGQIWRGNRDLEHLLHDVAALLAPDATLVWLSAYAGGLDPQKASIGLRRTLTAAGLHHGTIHAGRLLLADNAGRQHHTGGYALWQANT